MSGESILDNARRVAGPVIEDMGFELVDLRFVTVSGRRCLQFFIDAPGGVSLDDCQAVSREIETIIDVEDFVPGPYVLEVSSPGLDRPLYTPADFIRFAGSLARVRTKEPVGGQKVFVGRITSPDDSGFDIVVAGGKTEKTYRILYGQVEKARLEVEF